MITDQLVSFLPPESNIPILAAPVSSEIYDILGLGLGITPAEGNRIIGTRTLFGADTGIGGVKPQVQCAVGANAFVGGTSLNAAFQGAKDDGTGNPDTWQTFIETGAIVTANLTANAVFGRFDWPPEFPVGFQPRFLRILFTPVGTFSVGVVAYSVVTMGRPDNANRFAGKNFVVAG